MREIVALACTGCETPGMSLYWTMKNKKNDPDRIELKKYCALPPACDAPGETISHHADL